MFGAAVFEGLNCRQSTGVQYDVSLETLYASWYRQTRGRIIQVPHDRVGRVQRFTRGPPPLGQIVRDSLAASRFDIALRMREEGRSNLGPLVHVGERSTGGVWSSSLAAPTS